MQQHGKLALNASAAWKITRDEEPYLPDLVEHPSGISSVHTVEHNGSDNDRGLCRAHLHHCHHGLAKLTYRFLWFLGQHHKPEFGGWMLCVRCQSTMLPVLSRCPTMFCVALRSAVKHRLAFVRSCVYIDESSACQKSKPDSIRKHGLLRTWKKTAGMHAYAA